MDGLTAVAPVTRDVSALPTEARRGHQGENRWEVIK